MEAADEFGAYDIMDAYDEDYYGASERDGDMSSRYAPNRYASSQRTGYADRASASPDPRRSSSRPAPEWARTDRPAPSRNRSDASRASASRSANPRASAPREAAVEEPAESIFTTIVDVLKKAGAAVAGVIGTIVRTIVGAVLSLVEAVRSRVTGRRSYPSSSVMYGSGGLSKKRTNIVPIVAGVAAALILGFVIFHFATLMPVNITMNGQRLGLEENTTVAQAMEQSGTVVQPGRLVAVDGSVISENGGTPYTITVNGASASAETVLQDQDSVEVSDGQDEEEAYVDQEFVNATEVVEDETWGPIHQVVTDNPAARTIKRVGATSGITVDVQTATESASAELTKYGVFPTEKVIALTFDDGPWKDYTPEILDILRENDAKATFFVVGQTFDGNEEAIALLKREFDEGHQICTHTYTHAEAGGYDLGAMSHEQRIEDITKGQDAIERALGTLPSRMMRAPGGAYSADTAYSLAPYITYDINWDVDSLDWTIPGASAIEEALLTSEPGNIVLMHDGGGDRSETVEALRSVLPKMKADGWTFVTIDELLALDHGKQPWEESESDAESSTADGSSGSSSSAESLADALAEAESDESDYSEEEAA